MAKTPLTIIVGINDYVLFCQHSEFLNSPLIDNYKVFGKKYFLREKTYGGPYRQGKYAVIYNPQDKDYKYHRIRIWFSENFINLSEGTKIDNSLASGGLTNNNLASGEIDNITLIYDIMHKFDIYETVNMKNIDKNISISTKKLDLFNDEIELTSILISYETS